MGVRAAIWDLIPSGAVDAGVYLATNGNELPTGGSTAFQYTTQNNFAEEKAAAGLTFDPLQCKLTASETSVWLIRCYSSFYIPGFGNTGFIFLGMDKGGDVLALNPFTDYGNFLASSVVDIGGAGYGIVCVERRLELVSTNVVRPVGAALTLGGGSFAVNANFDHFVLVAQRVG